VLGVTQDDIRLFMRGYFALAKGSAYLLCPVSDPQIKIHRACEEKGFIAAVESWYRITDSGIEFAVQLMEMPRELSIAALELELYGNTFH